LLVEITFYGATYSPGNHNGWLDQKYMASALGDYKTCQLHAGIPIAMSCDRCPANNRSRTALLKNSERFAAHKRCLLGASDSSFYLWRVSISWGSFANTDSQQVLSFIWPIYLISHCSRHSQCFGRDGWLYLICSAYRIKSGMAN